jgi:hypothetical protein
MSDMKSFLERLQRDKNTKADRQEELKQWVSDLGTLMRSIEEYLSEGSAQKLLTVRKISESVSEPLVGSYDAPLLIIKMPAGLTVNVAPKGRYIEGTEGMVDLTGITGRTVSLIRDTSGAWKFKESGLALDKDSLGQVLDKLTSTF